MSKTKREQKPAATPEKPEAIAAAAATTPKPPRVLTACQLQVADLVADMITTGGDDKDLWPMLAAVCRHKLRPSYSDGTYAAPEDLERRLQEHANAKARTLYGSLKQEPPTVLAEHPVDPKDVVARIRQAVRSDLCNYMTEFLGEAGAEEVALLLRILRRRNGDGASFDDEQFHSQLPLATALMSVIGEDSGDWIKLPAWDVDRKLVDLGIETALRAGLRA